MERPVTPINDTIRAVPKTFSILCKHVRRRINPRPYWTHISVEDQRSLGAVILGEVNGIWSVFRQQVADPFLTHRQNKELQRRITVHIVTVCEQLFLYHCNRIKVLNARGVFSEAANLSRIRGQLALDAGKYLNLLAVRRHIIADLKKMPEEDSLNLIGKKDPVSPVVPKSPRHLSFRALIATSRPKLNTQSDFSIVQEIKDMKGQMPALDIGKVYQLLPKPSYVETEDDEQFIEDEYDPVDPIYIPKEQPTFREMKKWPSEPLLPTGGIFDSFKDRDDAETPFAQSRLQSTPKAVPSAMYEVHSAREVSSAPQSALLGGYRKTTKPEKNIVSLDPKEDLANLIKMQLKGDEDKDYVEEKDIPPLIQAISRREAQEEKMKELKKYESELDERKRLHDEEENKPLPDPKFPQPPVVQVKVPGHANPLGQKSLTIRTSDIHIPDKVDLPAVSLEMHGPLYNDLIGEISPATVKELDANLFQGEELKEVYDEIMKTVRDDHLHFDNDATVVKPAENIDLNRIFSSSTLTRPQSQQIINPDLRKLGQQPPWAGEPQDTWEKGICPVVSAATSGSRSNQLGPRTLHAQAAEKTSRVYASWLAWWKATLNTDDYFKYLSTKETDFLSVLYHFYNSEASESDTDSTSKSARLESERKQEAKLAEIKAKKEHYVRGLWNVNTVMVGGLGRYPDLEEYDQPNAANIPSLDEEIDLEMPETSRPLSPESIQLPQVNLAESADSESSFQEETSPRRKSASPRRFRTLQIPQTLSSSSEEESEDEEDTSSEVSKESTDDQFSTTTTSESKDLAPLPRGVIPDVRKQRDNFAKPLLQDSGLSSTEMDTDSTFTSTNMLMTQQEDSTESEQQNSTPGEILSDFNLGGNVQSAKIGTLCKVSIKIENITSNVTRCEHWRPSKGDVNKPSINLLKGYYKLSSSRAVSFSAKSPHEKATTISTEAKTPAPLSVQARLESVWKRLKMSSSQKLDAALKYSSDEYMPLLEESVTAWEKVAELILKREKLLHELEMFERDASDPHRFFFKGPKGSSVSRLQEAKTRACLYHKLEALEKQISPLLQSIYSLYNDIIAFEGRPYHEKMSLDKVEMLYWLQQERRCRRLYEQGQPEQLMQFMRDNHITVTKTTANTYTSNQIRIPVKAVTMKQ
ncbi:coiled-coil domain-containing protein 87-like isoform X2 [Clavelina lepadiformis]